MAVHASELGLDCRKCTPAERIDHGFSAPSPVPNRWEFDGEPLARCPVSQVSYQSAQYLKYFSFYRKGFLANEGTIACQPAKLLDAFTVIENEIETIRKSNEGK